MLKQKRCRYCKQPFTPERVKQILCSNVDCAIGYAEKVATKRIETQAKAERKELKARKQKLKTRSDWIKEVQIVFNKYIRLRDKYLPCICCDNLLASKSSSGIGGEFDCGHYRSVGSAPHLRFDERNAHGQRKQCNRWGSGRAVDYRIGLVRRIGLAAVEALEADNTPRHYTIDDLKALKAHYSQKCKDALKQQ